MKHWEQLRDTLCRELDEIAKKGELSAGDLETVDKLTHTMKNLDKIMMGEGECAPFRRNSPVRLSISSDRTKCNPLNRTFIIFQPYFGL